MAVDGSQSATAYSLLRQDAEASMRSSPPGRGRQLYMSQGCYSRGMPSPSPPSRQSTGGSIMVPASRQSTGTSEVSTVASQSDLTYNAYWQHHLALERRLEKVQERRGWKYFILHGLRVPLVFGIGVGIGSVLTFTMLSREHPGRSAWPFADEEADQQGFYATEPAPKSVPDEYLMAEPLNNSCLIHRLQPARGGPQTFDACGFVIRSTDAIWNLRGNVDEAIEKYFHEDYYNAGSWGRRGVGKGELRNAILSQMRAFPDIQIHITDCMCEGNDVDGYKCVMPDVLTGTNLGSSVYGPPTGRYARWTGMVESIVQRNPVSGSWQYVAEWGVHDEWALIQQLGLDFDKVPHPMTNSEPLHDCTPLAVFEPSASMNRLDKNIQEQRLSLE